jgi:DNA repair protein RadD
MAVDVKELILQNYETFIRYNPMLDIGVYSAGLKCKELDNSVILAGIQSIYKRGIDLENVSAVIIDECHRLSPVSTTRYQQFIAGLKVHNPDVLVIGFTATPFRLGQGMLTKGDNAIFEKIVYDISIDRLITDGYLSPLVTKGGIGKIDLTNVRVSAGDYNAKDLEHAATDDFLIEAAVREIIAYGDDRKAWLVFAAGVNHAKHVSKTFNKFGINSHTVYGDMSPVDRDSVIRRFKDGEIRCVINVNLLTTGFDYPDIDLIALLTATQSPNKYVQALGRGMRVSAGKQNCLVLDYGMNIMRHGPVDDIVVSFHYRSDTSSRPATTPMKECPVKTCRLLVPAATKKCPDCGYEWNLDKPEDRLTTLKAYSGPVMAFQHTPRWVPVMNAMYHRYNSSNKVPGSPIKPDTLLIEFFVATISSPIKMWLAFDSNGLPKDRAIYYATRSGGTARTVNEALEECDTWTIPTAIYIARNRNNPRYWVVQRWRWGDDGVQILQKQSKFLVTMPQSVRVPRKDDTIFNEKEEEDTNTVTSE